METIKEYKNRDEDEDDGEGKDSNLAKDLTWPRLRKETSTLAEASTRQKSWFCIGARPRPQLSFNLGIVMVKVKVKVNESASPSSYAETLDFLISSYPIKPQPYSSVTITSRITQCT